MEEKGRQLKRKGLLFVPDTLDSYSHHPACCCRAIASPRGLVPARASSSSDTVIIINIIIINIIIGPENSNGKEMGHKFLCGPQDRF